LANLAKEPRVIIIYESPKRLSRTLEELAGVMSNRQVLVVRELTKKFAQAWRGPLPEVAAQLQDTEIKGECALVLSCPEASASPEADLEGSLLQAAREHGLRGRRLAEAVAAALQLPRRRVYQAYLALKDQGRIG
jgi:16S rRNA (cytidine1402-2'-O)-methyltransferase